MNSKGITLVVLIMTIIIMLILAGVTLHFGMEATNKAKTEDIKTNMITVKTKAEIIAEKNSFDANNQVLIGLAIENNNTYEISADLRNILNTQEGEGSKYQKCYIWTQEDLNSLGLNTIKVDFSNFYIVDYRNFRSILFFRY